MRPCGTELVLLFSEKQGWISRRLNGAVRMRLYGIFYAIRDLWKWCFKKLQNLDCTRRFEIA